MAPDAPHRRPGRPVADAPIERLLTDPGGVTRDWMFALLSRVELHESPSVVTEPFTREGPRVCEAALRALAGESDLRRLEPEGALWPLVSRVGEMTGSASTRRVLTAVDALHDAIWSTLRGELRGTADPELVADLAARLTRVCALIRDAGLARAGDPGVSGPGGSGPGGPGGEAVSQQRSAPLWVTALDEEIEAARTSLAPLSLLLTELEDAERIAASAGPERAREAFEEFTRAVRRALRSQDVLVQEAPSRAWVIARETARAGAHSLGTRIAESVGETSLQRGTALVASVGVAVLGEDGIDCAQLMDAAEEARFAASARGVEVSRRMR